MGRLEIGIAKLRFGIGEEVIGNLRSLNERLTELMNRPDVALAAVVHCLTLKVLYSGAPVESCLQFSGGGYSLRRSLTAAEACKGFAAIEQEREHLADRLAGNPADLWQWCLDRSRDELLALITAGAVNAVQRKEDRPDCARLEHAADLAMALKLDVSAWFTPTADNYFGRINRAQILADIEKPRASMRLRLRSSRNPSLRTATKRCRHWLAAAGDGHRGK